MAVTMTSEAFGKKVDEVYTGGAEDWLVFHGYAERAGDAPGTTGPTDVTPDKDPTLAMNREDPGQPFELSGAFAAPELDSVSPATGVAAGGTRITIVGDHLSDVTGVTVGGVAGTNLAIVDDSKIRVTTGAHAAGAVDVVVTDPKGSDTLVGAFTYT